MGEIPEDKNKAPIVREHKLYTIMDGKKIRPHFIERIIICPHPK
jgi:hypothetical protein